ncbi:hypothetical protein E1301_Tti004914 [Triplophysa tibetana]|uniref:Uncharacterized protein n=1 Tax=Triplophysa tibetana TaxID=1572043 RepID=A0A5A9NWN3_9TELE|nr:hypothetical protein E1301_Tti004914 [Triplophysa tibetana]
MTSKRDSTCANAELAIHETSLRRRVPVAVRLAPRVFCLETSPANRSCENAIFWGHTNSAAEQRKRDRGNLSSQGEASSSTVGSDSVADPKDHLDPDPELPQCRIGTRRVDDMSFMISCTNWY